MATYTLNIKDVDFKRYDFRFDESSDDYIREEDGFTEEIIKRISEEKGDPEWVRELRLKCLDIYNNMDMPCWGPSIEEDIKNSVPPREFVSSQGYPDSPEYQATKEWIAFDDSYDREFKILDAFDAETKRTGTDPFAEKYGDYNRRDIS